MKKMIYLDPLDKEGPEGFARLKRPLRVAPGANLIAELWEDEFDDNPGRVCQRWIARPYPDPAPPPTLDELILSAFLRMLAVVQLDHVDDGLPPSPESDICEAAGLLSIRIARIADEHLNKLEKKGD